tara:strand:+ start:268 stop:453 length:186 start_codon:yes stop_codon:yes gene_type:complete
MTAIVIITTFALLVALIAWCTWMYEIHIPHIPETESERHVREMKLRIADAEWKLKREMGGV